MKVLSVQMGATWEACSSLRLAKNVDGKEITVFSIFYLCGQTCMFSETLMMEQNRYAPFKTDRVLLFAVWEKIE